MDFENNQQGLRTENHQTEGWRASAQREFTVRGLKTWFSSDIQALTAGWASWGGRAVSGMVGAKDTLE